MGRSAFLDAAQQLELEEQGFTITRLIDEDEVPGILGRIRSLDPSDGFAPVRRPEAPATYHCTFLDEDVGYRRRVDTLMREVFEPRTAAILDRYRMLTSNLYVKPPGTGRFEVHQNWPVTADIRDTTLTLWCPFVDVGAHNGTIHVVPGSHKIVPDVFTVGADKYFASFYDALIDHWLEPVELRAGECLIFDDSLLHWSDANESDEYRWSAQLVLMPEEETPVIFQYRSTEEPPLFAAYEVDPEFFISGNVRQLLDPPDNLRLVTTLESRNVSIDEDDFAQLMSHGPEIRRSVYERRPIDEAFSLALTLDHSRPDGPSRAEGPPGDAATHPVDGADEQGCEETSGLALRRGETGRDEAERDDARWPGVALSARRNSLLRRLAAARGELAVSRSRTIFGRRRPVPRSASEFLPPVRIDGVIDPAIADELQTNGFARCGTLLGSDECAELVEAFDEVARRIGRPIGDDWFPTILLPDPDVRAYIFDTLAATILPRLDGVLDPTVLEPVRIDYSVKPSGPRSLLGPHQDFSIVDERRWNSLYLWIPLIDTDVSNGTLHVLPGSHHYTNKVRARHVPSMFDPVIPEIERIAEPLVCAAGELVMMVSGVVHYSPPNMSDGLRLAAHGIFKPVDAPLLFYFADDDTPEGLVEVYEVDIDEYIELALGERPGPDVRRSGTVERPPTAMSPERFEAGRRRFDASRRRTQGAAR